MQARQEGAPSSRPGAEDRLAIVTLDAPLVPASDAVQIAEPSVVWAPRGHDFQAGATRDEDEWACLGWGVAARVTGSGARRIEEVRAAAQRLWSRLDPAQIAGLPFAPRLFGGFAFDAAGATESTEQAAGAPAPDSGARAGEPRNLASAWAAFGDAAFVLPETLYAYSDGRAILVAFVPEPLVPFAQRRLESIRLALADLAEPTPSSIGAARTPDSHARALPAGLGPAPHGASLARSDNPLTAEDPAERAYADLVARAVRAIEGGAFAKVVLCRARRVPLHPRARAALAFAHLHDRQPACARFFFAHGSSRLLGATPERLVLVRGRRVFTEALAGSLPRLASRADEGDGDAPSELLASRKDRAEHAFVVAAIRESLAPLCEALVVPHEPEIRALPHVLHLATPISCLLRERTHALDLAARLHPTPALCGSPTPAARAFLLEHEAQPRGWYGGAVGWFDADGDGSFGVAIRSALLAPGEAWIYAGAGIVRGSDPERELAETIAKERAMREALDAASAPDRAASPSPEAA